MQARQKQFFLIRQVVSHDAMAIADPLQIFIIIFPKLGR